MSIEERISELEYQVKDIEEKIKIETSDVREGKRWDLITFSAYEYNVTVPLKDAVRAILDHLGLQLDVPDPQPKVVLGAKTEKDEEESE